MLGGSGSERLKTSFRCLLPLLGMIGATWAALMLPKFWSEASINELSSRIVADDRFTGNVLSNALALSPVDSQFIFRRSATLRSEALICLQIATQSLSRQNSEEVDSVAAAAKEKLSASLVRNPTDSFLWLNLFLLQTKRYGIDGHTLAFLDQSYVTGPREGWISLRRNRGALAAFSMTSEDLQRRIVSEFSAMVDSGFIEQTEKTLIGVGWVHRDLLMRGLNQVDLVAREALSKQLARDGITIDLPGVTPAERFWR